MAIQTGNPGGKSAGATKNATTQPTGTPTTGYRSPGNFGRDNTQRSDLKPPTKYGENQSALPSSLMATGAETSDLSDFSPTQPNSDPVLARVIAQGIRDNELNAGWQERQITDKNVPNHPAMATARSLKKPVTIPGTPDFSAAPPVRKPGT